MMNFQLVPIEDNELGQYKADMQEAFQKGYEEEFGQSEETILPVKDIDHSLNRKGSVAYKALVDGKMAGGAIVVIDNETQHNYLDFLFVKYGIQSMGIGKEIWSEIEKRYPQTKMWETCTPYFDKRNIHFYVNKCGFHIVSFYHEKNPDPNMPDDYTGDGSEGMFVLKKQIQSTVKRSR